MKGALFFIALFALSMLIIPLMLAGQPEEILPDRAVGTEDSSLQSHNEEFQVAAPQSPPAMPVDEASGMDEPREEPLAEEAFFAGTGVAEFRILDETTGEILTVSARDFVRGAVAAEMPARFHSEALKAQAVAAHTYALYQHKIQQENPTPSLQGADFSADPGNRLVYMTEEAARAFYGANADEYWGKICAAADEVLDLVLVYQDEPIVAAYHAISAGTTEDAANVWSGSVPYLQSADSGGDLLAPDYETESVLSAAEVKEALLAEYPDMLLGEDVQTWFGEMTRSPSGYVTEIEVGGEILHGKDIRRMMGLRSHNFELVVSDRGFAFVTYGYGHGVGLSQYGADFMARQGADFREILENYYQGAILVKINT